MRYTIDNKTIIFSTVTWANKDWLALDIKAFNEAPQATQVVIKNRRGEKIWADVNTVLVYAVVLPPKRKMYRVPLSIFREVIQ